MSITSGAKNTMLNALAIAKASLHTAFPGSAGAAEVTGGSYAQVACTFGSASGAVRSMSAPINFSVPACTVEWVAFRDAGGVVLAYSPNGGLPQEYYVDPSLDTFYCTAHGYVANDPVVFFGDTTPAGLTEGVKVYVRDVTTNTFKVAATAGGAAIDITSAGGGACLVSRIASDVYGASGTHTINSCTIGLPN